MTQSRWLGRVPYDAGLALQLELHSQRVTGLIPDQFLYLDHEPVITYGRATDPGDLFRLEHHIPTVEVPRGGQATYHGPGQLVGYLVLDLRNRQAPHGPDIHAFLRAIEEGLIQFLQHEYRLPCCLREGFTGVWTQGFRGEPGMPRKLASIGVNARKWITSHGFALNLANDLQPFRAIVPCGITDAEMTTVAAEFERAGCTVPSFDLKELAPRVHREMVASLQGQGWLLQPADATLEEPVSPNV